MNTRDAVRRAYDELAETYAERRSPDELGADLLDPFLESLPEDARVLDAGCGQGVPVLERLHAEASAVGLDFSSEQLRLAAENVPGASLVRGDMVALPFRDGTFDAVTAYYSLIHVPLDQHQSVIDEFARVLAAGGTVLVSEGTTGWRGENPNWLDSGVEMRWDFAGAAATKEQLRVAGFTVIREWAVEDTLAEEDSRHPFFLARLD